jgi:hypothetical protein
MAKQSDNFHTFKPSLGKHSNNNLYIGYHSHCFKCLSQIPGYIFFLTTYKENVYFFVSYTIIAKVKQLEISKAF